MSGAPTRERSDLRSNPRPAVDPREIERLGPWFHNLHLPGGVETAPDHPLGDFPRFKWEALAPHLPRDLRGWSALDVGCNAGFYSFELARRGADVVGMDHDEHYLVQARWAAERLGLSGAVRFERADVYDLGRSDERYDLVLFMGVFYHLRYPLLGLDAVARTARRLLVFQSMLLPGDEARERTEDYELDDRDVLAEPGWPRMAFVEHALAGDDTNWWVPDRACVEALLRSTGLRIVARPERETYVCAPGEPQIFGSADELRRALRRSPER
ncbi:MAG TPA: TIGR04290 family methyltransferase [Longimicrobiales bacterium]|nr:TIGR04290 family methyltransferase [Longimicrobiales bacterium]